MDRTKSGYVYLLIVIGLLMAFLLLSLSRQNAAPSSQATGSPEMTIVLPAPRLESDTSIEAALLARRSIREYAPQPLTLAELGQLLWAAQGITGANDRYRTAPSAGALYPLELYVFVGDVDGLEAGVYHYAPASHELARHQATADRAALTEAALDQDWIAEGPVVLVVSAVYHRTTKKYGARGEQYVHMEAGHAAQNVALQAGALELGTVTVGAFDVAAVRRVVGLTDDETPLYLMPVGHLR